MTVKLKRVALLSTGGTIASVPAEGGRAVAGALSGEALLSQLKMRGLLDVTVESLFQKPSNAIGPNEWARLAMRCVELAGSGDVDGIVVTHGTDTMEDTAYYLQCVLDTSRVPVVITGSQRTPDAVGSDAFSNLSHALQLAASNEARGQGVLLSFNQSVFSASFVSKVSSFQLHGFDALGWGPQGMFDEGVFHRLQVPAQQPRLPIPSQLPRVDILPAYGGAHVAFAEAILASRPDGVVINALGRGQVPPQWMSPLREAIAAGIRVAVCSSTLHGPVYESYEYPGAYHELVALGVIGVNHLSARKARIRLALALAAYGSDAVSLAQAFAWQ